MNARCSHDNSSMQPDGRAVIVEEEEEEEEGDDAGASEYGYRRK